MRAIVLALLITGCGKPPVPVVIAPAPSPPGVEWVRGYERRNGTRVEGYWRTVPDGDKANNWSEKGNVNPVTGKPGTKE